MYQVRVTNQSQADAHDVRRQGDPAGRHPLGDSHIGGDTKETWRVLISHQGEEVVGRYEGGGKLDVTVHGHLQVTLGGMQLRRVFLLEEAPASA